MEEEQTLEGLILHLRKAFQSGETISELISDFTVGLRRRTSLKMCLQMTSKY